MTRKTHGGKGDRIPGADQAAYEANYISINWNARGETENAEPTVAGVEPEVAGATTDRREAGRVGQAPAKA